MLSDMAMHSRGDNMNTINPKFHPTLIQNIRSTNKINSMIYGNVNAYQQQQNTV
jgi:hypothetical protein